MFKQLNRSKPTVDLQQQAARPSRIRRDPMRSPAKVELKPRDKERELWLGVAGVVAMATACVAVVLGVSNATGQL